MPRASRVVAFLCLVSFPAIGVAQQPVLYTVDGTAKNDYMGFAVSGAGDVDGDGVPDVIVGAPAHDMPLSDVGEARVVSGATGAVIHTFFGAAAFDTVGFAVSGLGDVNGDGFDDVIVGGPSCNEGGTNAGRVQVFSGQTGALLFKFLGDNAGDELGASVSEAGDVNNDGFADLIAGAPFADPGGVQVGAARIYSGQNGTALQTHFGPSTFARFGHAVAGGGDCDQDGFADVIIGNPRDPVNGTAGAARVISGRFGLILYDLPGAVNLSEFGDAVADAGDANGDGFSDIAVGARSDRKSASKVGSARIYSGRNGGLLHEYFGDADGDAFGDSIDAVGDINGDGLADIVVGAPFARNPTGALAGFVRVHVGGTGDVAFTAYGPTTSTSFGAAVAGVGDFDQDGAPDFVAGAALASASAHFAGRAYVLGGRCGAWAPHGSGCAGSGGFTPRLSVGTPCVKNAGESFQLSITGALGGAPSLLFFGAAPAQIPLAGGCSLNAAPLVGPILSVSIGGTGPGAGTAVIPGTLPAGFSGVSLTLQSFIVDPGVPHGFTSTNGMTVALP